MRIATWLAVPFAESAPLRVQRRDLAPVAQQPHIGPDRRVIGAADRADGVERDLIAGEVERLAGPGADDLFLGPGRRAGDAGDHDRHPGMRQGHAPGGARQVRRAAPDARDRPSNSRCDPPARPRSRRTAKPPAPARRPRRPICAPVAISTTSAVAGGDREGELQPGQRRRRGRRASTAASARPPSRPAAAP